MDQSSNANRRGGSSGPSGRPAARGLQSTPAGRRDPVGIERAARSQGAPPRGRTPSREPAPPRPDLPEGEEPQLPRGVRREIDRVLGKGSRADDVALALSVGSQAIDLERPELALEVLEWAKHQAPRVAAVREALGVARYLDEDWTGALTELQAYRRMTARTDQNHVIADCLRALGRDRDRIEHVVDEMLADADAPIERRTEAVIIRAATLADAGHLAAGRAALRRFLRELSDRDTGASLRVHVLAADLAARDGDAAEAAEHRARVANSAPDLIEDPLESPAQEPTEG